MMNEIATAIREVGAALMESEGTNVDSCQSYEGTTEMSSRR